MNKLNYITADEWWDTDIDILKDLVKYFDVSIYVLSPASKRAKFPVKEVEGCYEIHNICYHFRKRNPFCAIYFLWFFVLVFAAAYRRRSLNFCLNGWHPFLMPFFLWLLPKQRTIISSHNFLSHNHSRNDPNVLFYKKYRYFHFHSKPQELLFKKAYPSKSSFYTKMPVKNFGLPQGKYKINHDEKINLLFFGLIRDYKRLDLLIAALNSLPNANLRLIIAGYCNDFSKYQKMIKDSSMYQLDIRFIKNEEIADLFTICDFLVLPYDDATQSGPSLIALHYGLPIIASDQPSFKEMIKEGETGFLFPKGDMHSLKKLLNQVALMSKESIKSLKEKQIMMRDEYSVMNAPHVGFNKFFQEHFENVMLPCSIN